MTQQPRSERDTADKEGKRTRERSTSYPVTDLKTALDDARLIYSHGKIMAREALTKSLGYGSATSGAAARRLAALNYYGLVSYDKGQSVLSDLGRRYFAPVSDAEPSSALSEAFLTVGPFKALYERMTSGTVSNKEVLGNIAERELGIATKAKKDFMDTFVKSGVFANLLEEVSESGLRLRETQEVARFMPPDSKLQAEDKIIEGEMRILPPRQVGSGVTLTIQLAIDSSMSPEQLEGLLAILEKRTGLVTIAM